MGKHWPQMLTTLMLGVTSSSSSSWPESFTFLSTCNNATFSAFVVPLALQVKLSYTATHGAYYNSSDAANGTVDGWSRVHDLDANPVAGGMHAIVFVEAPSPASAPTSSTPVAIPRVVVAFRGTDLDITGASGQADSCADAMLWDGTPRSKLPAYCSNFNDTTLDYLTAALDLTAAVQVRFPSSEIMLTGHSLGAGLAGLVAVLTAAERKAADAKQRPAVAFSSPGVLAVIANKSRHSVEPWTADSSRTFVLADEWDPVYHAANASLLGTSCQWDSP
eukprot:gene17853-2790_t